MICHFHFYRSYRVPLDSYVLRNAVGAISNGVFERTIRYLSRQVRWFVSE